MAYDFDNIDFTVYKNHLDFIAHNPKFHAMNKITFWRHKKKQLQKITQNCSTQLKDKYNKSLPIIKADENQSNLLTELINELKGLEQKTEGDKLHSLLTPKIHQILSKLSIVSIASYIPTQWQAAFRYLESADPEHFAKREAQGPLQTAIGIKLVISDDPDGTRTAAATVVQNVSNNAGNVSINGQQVNGTGQ